LKSKKNKKYIEEEERKEEISALTNDLPTYRYYGVKRKDNWFVNKVVSFFLAYASYCILVPVVTVYGIIIYCLYRYFGVFIPTIVTVVTLILLVRNLYFKKLGKRVKFERKLKKLCAKQGYIIERNAGFWRSMRFISEGYHLVVKTHDKNYYVRFITNFNYNTEIIFSSKTEIRIHRDINAHKNKFKVIAGIRESYETKPFKFDLAYGMPNEKYENVVLLNPVPREICYIDRDGMMTPTGSGEKMFGYTIYNGSDFLFLLKNNI
jgi:hypothetical protein